MDPADLKHDKKNLGSPHAARDGTEDAHSSGTNQNTFKLGIGRHLAAVGQLSNQHFKKLRSRLQSKLNTAHGLDPSDSDSRRVDEPVEDKPVTILTPEIQEVASLSSFKSVSLSSSSHSKPVEETTKSATLSNSPHLPTGRGQLRFLPEVFDEISLHDDYDAQLRKEESKYKNQPDGLRVHVHQGRSLGQPSISEASHFLKTNSDRKTYSNQRFKDLLLSSEESLGELPPNEDILSNRGGASAFILNDTFSFQSNDLSSNIMDTDHSASVLDSSSMEMPKVGARQGTNAPTKSEIKEGISLMNPAVHFHTFKGTNPFSESQNVYGMKESKINKYSAEIFDNASKMSNAKQKAMNESGTKQNVAHPFSEQHRKDDIKNHVSSSADDRSATGVTTPPHVAVPVFSKDVHKAIKNVMRYRHANEEAQQLAPAETAFPKSTIILDRAQTGSPYFRNDPLTGFQAPPLKSHNRDAYRMTSPAFDQQSMSAFLPRRPAPLPPPLHSPAPQYPDPPRNYTAPYLPPYLPATFPPQAVHFHPSYYAVSNPPAPNMMSRDNERSNDWHSTPTAPVETVEHDYSRLKSSRSSGAPSSWYDTLASFFGFKSTRLSEEPPVHRSSFTPSDHRDSLGSRRSFLDRGFQRTMEPTPAPSVRFNQRTTGDDLILQLACCCCWPVGLAARIIMILVPSHQASCVALLARQMSIYALLLGIAVYLFIMVTFIALLLALVKDRG